MVFRSITQDTIWLYVLIICGLYVIDQMFYLYEKKRKRQIKDTIKAEVEYTRKWFNLVTIMLVVHGLIYLAMAVILIIGVKSHV